MVDITGSVILPILFLVILQLCDIARGIDLAETTRENFWHFPLGPGIPLGPHAMIHAVNYFSLSAMFMGLSAMYSGRIILDLLWNQPADPVLYLLIVAFSILVLLPILEVNGYGKAETYSWFPIPESAIIHFIGVGSLLVATPILEKLRASRPDVDSFWEMFEASLQAASMGPIDALIQAFGLLFLFTWMICGMAFILAIHSEMSKLDIEPGEYS